MKTFSGLKKLSNAELLEYINAASKELLSREAVATPPIKLEKVFELPTREKAIKFAKDSIHKLQNESGLYLVKDKEHGLARVCTAVFKRDSKNGRVKVELRGKYSNTLYSFGTAKVQQGDVFNVYIGEAIALYRALGKDVPEILLNHEQPTEPQVGDIVKSKSVGSLYQIINRGHRKNMIILDTATEFKNLVGELATGGKDFEWAILVDDSKTGYKI